MKPVKRSGRRNNAGKALHEQKTPGVVFDCNLFLQAAISSLGPAFACMNLVDQGSVVSHPIPVRVRPQRRRLAPTSGVGDGRAPRPTLRVVHVARLSVAWRCPSWDGCGGSAAAWWGLGNLLTKSMGWVLGIDPRRGRCPLTPLLSAPSSVAPSLCEGRGMTGPRAREDREGGIIDKGGRKTPRAGRLFRPRWQSSPALGGYNSISREACGDGHALERRRRLPSGPLRSRA